MTQAMLGDVAVTRLVLGRGGEPTAVDNSGSTALLQAARGGHAEVVDLYLAQPTVAVRHIFCFCFFLVETTTHVDIQEGVGGATNISGPL